MSPTAYVEETSEGAKITITDINGTTEATVKHGKDGQPGKDGAPGKDGIDGTNGMDGKDGADGYTPRREVDYWTDADKAEIKSYVDEAILGGAW